MKWLITGGCGFIGSSLVKKILREGGHEVRIVDNLSVGKPSSLDGLDVAVHESPFERKPAWRSGRVDIYVSDIVNDKEALLLTEGADVIVHLAANTGVAPSVENPRMDCVTNVIGTLNYLEGAKHHRVPRFIFASSGAPAGEVTPPIHEEVVPHPVSPYGASKLCGEAYCSAYFKTFGVQTIALRFGNVYGPGSTHKSSVVARFLSAIFSGQDLTIYGDGSQTRDFIYLYDLLKAIFLAADVPGIGGEIFQIATNQETQVIEIAEMLRDIARKHEVKFPNIRLSERRVGDVQRNFSDTTKAKTRLGWVTEKTLYSGLEDTFLWFRENSKKMP